MLTYYLGFINIKDLYSNTIYFLCLESLFKIRGSGGRDRMVVGFTTTYAINAQHHLSCDFESRSWISVLNTTLCNKVCQ